MFCNPFDLIEQEVHDALDSSRLHVAHLHHSLVFFVPQELAAACLGEDALAVDTVLANKELH